jgi:hypothetical protein
MKRFIILCLLQKPFLLQIFGNLSRKTPEKYQL